MSPDRNSHNKRAVINTQKTSAGEWITRHRIVLCLAFITLVSIFLRFYDLGTQSIWLDEAESIKESFLSIQGMADHSNQPPLYFLMLRGWISLFGTSEIALRSLSAVLGVLTVVIIYFIGNALFNQKVGLMGAFLSSFAFFLVFQSQNARAYSLLLLVSSSSYWCFIEILRKNENKFYVFYIISSILLIFTHFYSLFIIASQLLFLLIFFKKYKTQRLKFVITICILIAAMVPMLLLLKDNIFSIASNGFWIPEPEAFSILNTLVIFSGIGQAKYVIFAIFVLCAIWGFFVLFKTKQKPTKRKTNTRDSEYANFEPLETLLLLLFWLFIPILIPFIESKLMTPIFQTKYVIGTYPALCLIVANGLSNIKWQWVLYPVLVLIVILSSFGLYDYYKYGSNEQWRETARYIEARSQPDDIIVFCESYYQDPFNYYYKGNIKETGITSVDDADRFISSPDGTAIKNQGRLWLVLAYNKYQIYSLFENTYGKSSIKLIQQYLGITIVLFDTSAP